MCHDSVFPILIKEKEHLIPNCQVIILKEVSLDSTLIELKYSFNIFSLMMHNYGNADTLQFIQALPWLEEL